MCYILYGDNMNKNGFTLIELMAVIVILAIIAVITTPVVVNVISNVRSELSREQKQIVENSARMWGVKNLSLVKEGGKDVPSIKKVTINELKAGGYIEKKELRNLNLSSSELNTAGVCITYDNQYLYTFTKNVNTCSP